jgi:hypothetical protein
MKKLVSLAARQKFRFDLGITLLPVINLCLLAVACSGTLSYVCGLPPRVLVPAVVAAALAAVWLCGWALDKARFPQAYAEESNRRNEMLVRAVEGKDDRRV